MNYYLCGSSSIEVNVADVGGAVLRSAFATVYRIEVVEVPQPPSADVGIINVSLWGQRSIDENVGACVMFVGRDSSERVLWACYVPGVFRTNEPLRCEESLLVAPEVLGKTTRLTLLLYGGRLCNSAPASEDLPREVAEAGG
jgi:hypothetical protein